MLCFFAYVLFVKRHYGISCFLKQKTKRYFFGVAITIFFFECVPSGLWHKSRAITVYPDRFGNQVVAKGPFSTSIDVQTEI